MKTPEEIGKIVRELRGEMSLRDFASMCKLSHTALDAIECGYNKRSKKPTHTKAVTLQRIADAGGVTLEYILGDNERKMNQFSEKIKELRIAKNMTQLDLAKKVGLSASAVAMYERGEREPGIELLVKYAEIFDVDMNTLFEYKDEDPLIDCKCYNGNSFSQRFREALEINNIKPSELSRRTHISEASISHYLSGDYTPKLDKLNVFAKELNVSPQWLAGFNVPMEPAEPACAPRDRLDELMLSMFNKLSLAHQEEVIKYINNLSSKEN